MNSAKVYVMASELGLVKIGYSGAPELRAQALSNASGMPVRLVHTTDFLDRARLVEAAAHLLRADAARSGK